MNDTPLQLGFSMPPEWEPHESTWLTWPQTTEYWPDIEAMESLYISIIRALTMDEKVNLLVNNNFKKQGLLQKFQKEGLPKNKINLHVISTKDIWIRDYGPTFLVHSNNKELASCNWTFNAWGKKYEMPSESKVAYKIQKILGLQNFTPGVVMEGGAIEVNGNGICLTTESCLLNSNRNPGKTKKEMENYLKNFLGIKKVIWCEGSLEGDDTDSHIDNLARFVNANTIFCAYENNTKDVNHQNLKNNYKILIDSKDLKGNSFNVIKVPMPGIVQDNQKRLPASYINFYIANRTVLVPIYDHPEDTKVLNLFKHYFPGREIFPLLSKVLITGNGGPHCVTQQQPKT